MYVEQKNMRKKFVDLKKLSVDLSRLLEYDIAELIDTLGIMVLTEVKESLHLA